MGTRTAAQLVEGGRRKADVQVEVDRHTPAECLDYVNKGIAWVARTLSRAQGYAFYGRTWLVMGEASVQAGGAAVSFSGTPVDECNVVVEITSTADLAVMVFTVSLDGGATVHQTTVINGYAGATVPVTNMGFSVVFPASAMGAGYNAGYSWSASTTYPPVQASLRWVALPEAVLHIHSVAIIGASDRAYPLELVTQTEEHNLEDDDDSNGYPTHYRFRGHLGTGNTAPTTGGAAKLDLYPRPSAAHLIIVRYTPYPGVLALNDAWDALAGHEDAVEYFVAREIFEKDDRLDRAKWCQGQLDKWEAALKTQQPRVTGDAPRVKDVRDRQRDVGRPRPRWVR